MKKVNNKFYFCFICLTVFGCKNDITGSKLHYYCSVESVYAWSVPLNSNVVLSEEAHSGVFMCKIDSISAYSTTFRMRVKDISKNLKKVKYSAWIMLKDLGASPFLVAEFRDKDNKVTDWLSYNVLDELNEEGEWVKITTTADLTQNNRNEGETEIRIYVSNGKSVPAYVDDIEVEFFK